MSYFFKVVFKEKLPYDLAPTFRGQFAKYTYKLTIGVQKLNRNTQLLRLPFRVFSLLDFEKYIPRNDLFIYEYSNNVNPSVLGNSSNSINTSATTNRDSSANNIITNSSSKKRNSTLTSMDRMSQQSDSFEMKTDLDNPFKIEEKSDYENLEYALQVIEDLTAASTTCNYNVTSPDGKIVKITLNKTNYKVGDKIVAFLDFSDAQVSCVEVII